VTAQVLGDPESLLDCAGALLGDSQYGVLVSPLTYGYAPSAKRPLVYNDLAIKHGKMACVVWQTEWQDGPGVVEANGCERVALFRSMNACFTAIAAWQWRADKRAAGPQTVKATSPGTLNQARSMLAAATGETVTEREVKALLSLYGVPVVGEQLTQSADAAVAAAEALGYPVVMKVESPDIPHKTEAKAVHLGVAPEDAAAAFESIMQAARAYKPDAKLNGVVVQEMVKPGVEMMLGIAPDPVFGSVVVAGLGGILVEVLRDVAHRIPPIDADEVRAMLDGLRGAPILRGVRGAAPRDLDALVDAIVRLSWLAFDLPEISELDINPLILGAVGEGACVVDAMVKLV